MIRNLFRTMTTEDRDEIRSRTGIPGTSFDSGKPLPISDCGNPLQDIINDINTRLADDNEVLRNA